MLAEQRPLKRMGGAMRREDPSDLSSIRCGCKLKHLLMIS